MSSFFFSKTGCLPSLVGLFQPGMPWEFLKDWGEISLGVFALCVLFTDVKKKGKGRKKWESRPQLHTHTHTHTPILSEIIL